MKNLILSLCPARKIDVRLAGSAFWDHLLNRDQEPSPEHRPGDDGQPVAGLEQTVERLSRTVAALEARLKAVEAAAAHTPVIAGGPKRLVLTDRAQALRMARDGKNPVQIAQALGLAQGEVRLLIRVHEFRSQLEEEAAASGNPG